MAGAQQKAGWWDSFKKRVGRARDWLVELALVAWICRVSVVSTALGIILFIFIPQVRDTFLEVRKSNVANLANNVPDLANIAFWALFLLSALVFWALPVHYAARRDIRNDPAYAGKPLAGSSLWFPRILGLACLASIAVGAYRAQFGFLNPTDPDDALTQTRVLMYAAILLSIGLFLFLWQRRKIFTAISSRVGTILMTALTIGFFVFFFVDISHYIWRAPLLPLLLGGWVPVFAWLAYEGRQYRVPFILLLFVALEGLAWFGDNHDVRRIWIDGHASMLDKEPLEPKFKRESVQEAITRWRVANSCSDDIGKCPRPIVIAASGGASRAGFFTAGVLGELMDRSTRPGLEGIPGFARRLFAISTVSGSSTGAAFFIAALQRAQAVAVAKHETIEQPCIKDPDELAYFEDAPASWRQCMEQLLAGDFISPTLFGFVYQDAIRGLAPVLNWPKKDRATLLEASWEDRFCLSTEGKACAENEVEGMRAPFLSVSGRGDTASDARRDDPNSARRWIPILLLNGTDVATGRRVVVSPLSPRVAAPLNPLNSDKRLFPDAYDLHDLLVDETDSGSGLASLRDRPQQNYIRRDVRLSTAALLSARFPVISPPGNIRNAKDQILTRIIDGGYFENFGAATAADIVTQLKQTCKDDDKDCLNPFVIEITNDPEFLLPNLMAEKDSTSNSGKICENWNGQDPLKLWVPPVVDAPDRLWFSGIMGPIEGLLGSRGAQGGRALRALSDLGDANFLHIYVSPLYFPSSWNNTCEVADVSMSWWLSKPVQRYLNDQIDKNCSTINGAILKIRKASPTLLNAPSDGCPGKRTSAAQ